MAAMTKKERVRATLDGRPVDRLPVSLWGHDFLREWSASDLAEQTLESYRLHDWDFIKLNPRWTFFAEAWGNTYEPPTEQRFPRLTGRVVEKADDLQRIAPLDADGGVFGEHLDALSGVLDAAGDEADVVYTLFSPLAVCSLLVGRLGEPLTDWARDDSGRRPRPGERPADLIHSALEVLAETLTAHARAALVRGAAGIFYAPLQWTSGRLCDDAFYREYGRPYDLRILESVRQAPFNILHVCGDDNRLEELLDYPVAAFNWDDHGEGNASLARIQQLTDRAVMGGISHTGLGELEAGDVVSYVEEALQDCSRPVFLTGGCGVSPLVPDEIRRAVRQTVDSLPRFWQ